MSLDALLFQQGGRCFYCRQPLRYDAIAHIGNTRQVFCWT
jgi:hypothetical protein